MAGEIISKTDTTMVQKIIWMRYLLFGISSILVSVFNSCSSRTELPIRNAIYVYKNSFKDMISMEAYGGKNFFSYGIPSQDSIVYYSRGESVFPFYSDYVNNFPLNKVDSIKIRINGKCVLYKNLGSLESEQKLAGGVFNLKEYENYSSELVKQKNYTLRYIIDSTDYKKAVPCK